MRAVQIPKGTASAERAVGPEPDMPAPAPEHRRHVGMPVLHPLLFAAFPVLYLFTDNITKGVQLADVWRPLTLVVGATAAVFVILSLLLRNTRKAGVAVSALVALFFSYGYVSGLTQGWSIAGIQAGSDGFLTVLWEVLAVAAVVAAIRTRRRLFDLTTILNVVSGGLVALNLLTIGFVQLGARPDRNYLSVGNLRLDPLAAAAVGGPRDIYYIMVEDYAGGSTLRNEFGLDNQPFLDELAARGFYVAADSSANYPMTLLSLASSLNMQYLDPIADAVGTTTGNASPAISSVRNSEVVRLLKAAGYGYVHIGSWWGPSTTDPEADSNIEFGGLSEFSTALYKTTALWPIASRFSFFPDTLNLRVREQNRFQFQFDQLDHTRQVPGPKFVFAHIISPHAPYVFDRSGRFVTNEQEASRSEAENYVEQLLYVNKRLLELLDQLLSGPEETRPIIILQSDEGPFPGQPEGWVSQPPRLLAKKFPILNAYFLPGASDPGMYQSITPVNSFRVVFDRYFDAGLPLLPDRNFVYQDLSHFYKFTDVTEQLRSSVGMLEGYSAMGTETRPERVAAEIAATRPLAPSLR
jgi:hypothetical protein